MDRGSYVQHEGRPAVRFERTYPHPVGKVWAALTEPSQARRWFPAQLEIEPRVGGVARFFGDEYAPDGTGTVLAYEPLRRLAFTWGSDELYLELEALDGNRTRLTLIDVLEGPDSAARNAAGWEVCLRELDAELAGEPHDGPHSETAEPWQPAYDRYVAAGLPAGAPIPT